MDVQPIQAKVSHDSIKGNKKTLTNTCHYSRDNKKMIKGQDSQDLLVFLSPFFPFSHIIFSSQRGQIQLLFLWKGADRQDMHLLILNLLEEYLYPLLNHMLPITLIMSILLKVRAKN